MSAAPKRVVCDGTCKHDVCGCGAFADGVLRDGVSLSIPMMFMDGAPRDAGQGGSMRDATTETADRAHARAEAAFDHYVEQLGAAWQVQDRAPVQGDPADAYTAMCDRLGDAWRAD